MLNICNGAAFVRYILYNRYYIVYAFKNVYNIAIYIQKIHVYIYIYYI